MTNYNERLDDILENLCSDVMPDEDGHSQYESEDEQNEAKDNSVAYTKQAILRWVADEVIGDDEEIVHHKTIQANNDNQIIRNSQRQKQRNILARHGYKGGE